MKTTLQYPLADCRLQIADRTQNKSLKLALILLFNFIAFTNSYSQSGQKYSTGLNTLTSSDGLGSLNYEGLNFYTNNIKRGSFTKDGAFDLLTRSYFHSNIYCDSLLTAMKISAQEVQAVTATISGNAQIDGTLLLGSNLTLDGTNSRVTSISGTIDFDASNLTTTGNISSSNVQVTGGISTVSLLVTGSSLFGGNTDFSGNLNALKISTDTFVVSGAGMIHALLLTDGVAIQPFGGTAYGGIVRYNTLGVLKRLDFPPDTNAVLTGGGIFKNIGGMVAPYTGWQWYNTSTLLSSAPVVAVQHNLEVGGKVSIGSLRLTNGSAVDTFITGRSLAVKAKSISMNADTVNLQNYAIAATMSVDTMRAEEIASDRVRTAQLELTGDLNAGGSLNSNEVNTRNIYSTLVSTDSLEVNGSIHIHDSVKIGSSIWLGGKDLHTLTNHIYSDNGDLFIQSSGYAHNTIIGNNLSNVGIGVGLPLAKFHVRGASFFEGHVGIGTNNPFTTLHIKGESGSDCSTSIRLEHHYTGTVNGCSYNQPFYFDFSAYSEIVDPQLRINSSFSNIPLITFEGATGFVGIGTPTPSEKLEVAGNIKASGLAGTGERIVLANETGTLSSTIPLNGTGSIFWSSTGNNGITAGTNFLGTTDGVDLVFKTNGNERMRIDNLYGHIGIGTNSPNYKLEVFEDATDAVALMVGDNSNRNMMVIPHVTAGLWNPISVPGDIGLFFRNQADNTGGSGLVIAPQRSGNIGGIRISPEGFVGICDPLPSAVLEVQNKEDVYDKVIASFNKRSSDDAFVKKIFFVPHLSSGGFNNLSQAGDAGIFWTYNSILIDPGTLNETETILNPSPTTGPGMVIAPNRSSASGIRITDMGLVGIGTHTPSAQLEVERNSNDFAMAISNTYSEGKGLLITAGSGTSASSNYAMLECQDASGYPVFRVDGYTNKVFMRGFKTTITAFPDYVFEKNYSLMSLAELENYLKKHKHLPGMLSAKEIEGQEVDIPELIGKQFEKTEELFLYVIELHKENQELKRNQKKQDKKIAKLYTKIDLLMKKHNHE